MHETIEASKQKAKGLPNEIYRVVFVLFAASQRNKQNDHLGRAVCSLIRVFPNTGNCPLLF